MVDESNLERQSVNEDQMLAEYQELEISGCSDINLEFRGVAYTGNLMRLGLLEDVAVINLPIVQRVPNVNILVIISYISTGFIMLTKNWGST